MIVTYNWLKSLVDFDYSPEELVDVLTMLGLEVDAIEKRPRDFDGLLVGRVTHKSRHENSDKLWVCRVDIGGRELSLVCGAPNVEVGQKVPVAPENSSLPDGTAIRKASIRGVESEGMICSELELGLTRRGEGIMVLDDKFREGKKLKDVLGDGDVIIDIDVTPNRPDCFGVLGIAREIGAVADSRLKKPAADVREHTTRVEDVIKIEIRDSQKCPRYSARFIAGVSIKPSPFWLAERLESVGIRSISNVVDITNYVMWETGQPLHAFDYALLKKQQIIVQVASNGQKFTTLDDKVHELNDESLMICDGERPVALGGIMGGLNSEVSDDTTDVLLESAYFSPVNIRRTAKRLGISTESSKRFERDTDPNGTLYALNRAAQLISELAGGEVARGVADVYPAEIKPRQVPLRPARVSLLLGKDIPSETTQKCLANLELSVEMKSEGELVVTVPTFRPDLTREADLIEEVGRVYGFNNIEPNTIARIEQLGHPDVVEARERRLSGFLLSLGISQVITYHMIPRERALLFADIGQLSELLNPISENMTTLRPSLFPGLLSVVGWNINRKSPNQKLFEIGTVFRRETGKVTEATNLGAVFTGLTHESSWVSKASPVSIYDVKGVVTHLCSRNLHGELAFTEHETSFTTANTLGIELDKKSCGFLGQLRDDILEEFDIGQPVFVLELDMAGLLASSDVTKAMTAIPKFPPSSRDLAIVVESRVKAGDVLQKIRESGGGFLRHVDLFDVYEGKQVAKGYKSLAFNLTFYSLERTLKEEEVDNQISIILESLKKDFLARLRD